MTDQPETSRADLERLLSEITPGPWDHRPHWSDDDKAEVYPTHGGKPPAFGQYAEIAEVSTHNDNHPEAAFANARAIAMVPDLLRMAIAALPPAPEALDESDLDEAWKSGFNAGFGEAKLGERATPSSEAVSRAAQTLLDHIGDGWGPAVNAMTHVFRRDMGVTRCPGVTTCKDALDAALRALAGKGGA